VLVGGEAGREEGVDAGGAALDIEDAVAASAVEVMVVVFGGLEAFVAWGLAGDVDGDDLLGLDEALEVAVDGGDAEVGDVAPGEVEDLGGAQWSLGVVESTSDGVALSGGAFHAV